VAKPSSPQLKRPTGYIEYKSYRDSILKSN